MKPPKKFKFSKRFKEQVAAIKLTTPEEPPVYIIPTMQVPVVRDDK